jgi:hypothetical protein
MSSSETSSERSYSPKDSDSLETRILRAYTRSIFDDRPQDFLPESYIAELITKETIIEKLNNDDFDPSHGKNHELVSFILESANRVFAITVMCGCRGSYLHKVMRQFKQYNFQDASLPLKSDTLSVLPCFDNRYWNVLEKRRFLDVQWTFLAPVFSRKEFFRLELESEHILPFTFVSKETKEGAFSQVPQITIHPSHQKYSHLTVRSPVEQVLDRG